MARFLIGFCYLDINFCVFCSAISLSFICVKCPWLLPKVINKCGSEELLVWIFVYPLPQLSTLLASIELDGFLRLDDKRFDHW